MRYFVLLAAFSALLWPQARLTTETQSATLPAGSQDGTLKFTLSTAPSKDDFFEIFVPDARIQAALLMPDGRTFRPGPFDESTGLAWEVTPTEGPLGTPRAYMLKIWFLRSAPTGTYQVQFDASKAKAPAAVNGGFRSSRIAHGGTIALGPGFKQTGPIEVPVSKQPVTATLVADAAMELGVLDILVSDPGAKVSVKLPDGRVASADKNGVFDKAQGFEAATFTDRGAWGGGNGFINFGGMLLPGEGTHHTFTFENLAAGTYEILVQPGSQKATVDAALIPFAAILKSMTERISTPGRLPPGESLLYVSEQSPQRAFVGQPVTFQAAFRGAPIKGPIQFQLKLEYSKVDFRNYEESPLNETTVVDAEPVVERAGDGTYLLKVVPTLAGSMRVQFTALGRDGDGRAFKEVGLARGPLVRRVAATLASLKERPKVHPERGKIEALEIVAELNVKEPGRYEAFLSFDDGSEESRDLSANAEAELAAGRQTMTFLLPAGRIRRLAKDGPLRLRHLSINRKDGESLEEVNTENFQFQTASYRRDQWDRGDTYSGATAVVKGIQPNSSGRYRLLEVEWDVTVSGGGCQWTAMLEQPNEADEPLTSTGRARLPKGRHRIQAYFGAGAFASAKSGDWRLTPTISCGETQEESAGEPEAISVMVKTAELEKPGPIRVQCPDSPSLATSEQNWTFCDVFGPKSGEQVSLSFGAVPGIRIKASEPSSESGLGLQYGLSIIATNEVKLGRHFIPVTAKAKGMTGSTFLVVEIRGE